MDNKLSYDRDIPATFDSLSREHKQVLSWVGRGKKVLEVACHTGYFSAWLCRQECQVIGAEIYGPALEKAKPFLSRGILGDIEKDDVWAEISREKYDVVLYMHILEHLVNPGKILQRTKEILTDGGFVIVCLPNINNWEARWQIFKGNFNYTDTGVMDRTHLRFFNYFTAIDLIQKAGFIVEEYSGDSWKVQFGLFPHIKGMWRINKIINWLILRLASPNLTDKVTMYKASAKK